MVIGMIHGRVYVTIVLTHITALKRRSFCRSPTPRICVALSLSTSPENAFFNLRMKKQDRTIMVASAQHCALEKTSDYVAYLSNTQTAVPLSASASFACHRTKASCRKTDMQSEDVAFTLCP